MTRRADRAVGLEICYWIPNITFYIGIVQIMINLFRTSTHCMLTLIKPSKDVSVWHIFCISSALNMRQFCTSAQIKAQVAASVSLASAVDNITILCQCMFHFYVRCNAWSASNIICSRYLAYAAELRAAPATHWAHLGPQTVQQTNRLYCSCVSKNILLNLFAASMPVRLQLPTGFDSDVRGYSCYSYYIYYTHWMKSEGSRILLWS